MANSCYKIPAYPQLFERLIKRSRFLTAVDVAIDTTAAQTFIDHNRSTYPDANHHCWAYVAGAPDDVYVVDKSDDGEPRGTAGKPMLNVLQHSGLGQIVVVVTRYFGGVKLGAGGLVRAYTQCVSEALLELETTDYVQTCRVELQLPYDVLSRVEHWLQNTQILIEQRDFGVAVTLVVQVPLARMAAAHAEFVELGQGQLQWRPLDHPADPQ